LSRYRAGRWRPRAANISAFAKKLAMIFFALFLLGFLALFGFAYLVAGAVSSSELLPALVAVSV
jgi:hypothetical protein